VSIICLLDNPEVVIASGKRVFSAEETGALLSLADSADRLQATVQSEEDRIVQAENVACERGREEGLAQGRQIATTELAKTNLTLVDQANAELAQVREEVLSLALQVVRKIADGVAPDDMIYSLATAAAQECLPSRSIVLKVHPDSVDGVKKRLAQFQATSDTSHPVHNIVADEELDADACVLETDAGQVCADLDTQLGVLEKHLAAAAVQTSVVPADNAAPVMGAAESNAVDSDVIGPEAIEHNGTAERSI